MSIYGSVNSAYDSSRPGSHARDDQVPIIIAVSLSTFPTNWASVYSYNWKDRQSNIRGQRHLFDDLSDDWAPATEPSYGDRLFYLVCKADYSVVPDDKNEAEKC
mmetsp:Transcript_14958/g.25490  ORF Transcript_14958/g.25490 Transcript_14958/m.25490 type:complete len:104 (-) Transcript_14958:331-642(-)